MKPRARPPRRTATLPLLASALFATLGIACAGGRGPRISAEEAVLERQTKGLGSLIRAAERGPLIPFDKILVVVDQTLVQDLLSTATPFERVIAGRYRIRIDAASVLFDDGFALVRLDGRASRAGHAFEEDASAEISVFGGLDIVELDPASGVLRGQVTIVAVEARRAAILGVKAPVERLVESLGREKLEAFGALASRLEIPVRLDSDVRIPAVGPQGGIRIAAATIPLHAAVHGVTAFRGKLWIRVDASTELK